VQEAPLACSFSVSQLQHLSIARIAHVNILYSPRNLGFRRCRIAYGSFKMHLVFLSRWRHPCIWRLEEGRQALRTAFERLDTVCRCGRSPRVYLFRKFRCVQRFHRVGPEHLRLVNFKEKHLTICVIQGRNDLFRSFLHVPSHVQRSASKRVS
jgi:hypothetical protein